MPRHQAVAAPIAPRPLVRPTLGQPQSVEIQLDARSAYDFLLSACPGCGDESELLPEDRQWHAESHAKLVAELGPEATAEEFLDFIMELGTLLVARPELRTARDFVRALDETSDEELLRLMTSEMLEDAQLGPIVRRLHGGDREAFGELAAALETLKGRRVLPDSPEILLATVRRVAHAWLEPFEQIEPRVQRIIERDAASRNLKAAAADPYAFIEQVTNGIRFAPERGVSRVILAPSYSSRPYNTITRTGSTRLICYPIADESLGAADRVSPPQAAIRLYRALGDETRLRILRLLAERDWYLTELATELDLSKPTISHHLAQLRSAGLVSVTDAGNLTYYTLRRGRIDEAGVELKAFLAR